MRINCGEKVFDRCGDCDADLLNMESQQTILESHIKPQQSSVEIYSSQTYLEGHGAFMGIDTVFSIFDEKYTMGLQVQTFTQAQNFLISPSLISY
ncbi:hypothetical protein ANAPRD1_00011 [Anaplasma phagocytophilum]|uniref:hypothetical protein n=1 Tax=Anaplasma phagocytophilum TaxID=948 RepID=UPI0007E07953|nr:hypothetical protein [Anaplasma phagocytophilum]SCV61528.1 hypothetical protein ANAPRD1_00011 [Anaplasma phagocytophilum]SCV65576.1 hypothetical protein ANAPH1_00841 [Anaplasma phagocytophilum]SCV66195.1 hypothetical protein ANAPH2_01511 [Anaplasma phagocytophilum]